MRINCISISLLGTTYRIVVVVRRCSVCIYVFDMYLCANWYSYWFAQTSLSRVECRWPPPSPPSPPPLSSSSFFSIAMCDTKHFDCILIVNNAVYGNANDGRRIGLDSFGGGGQRSKARGRCEYMYIYIYMYCGELVITEWETNNRPSSWSQFIGAQKYVARTLIWC